MTFNYRGLHYFVGKETLKKDLQKEENTPSENSKPAKGDRKCTWCGSHNTKVFKKYKDEDFTFV